MYMDHCTSDAQDKRAEIAATAAIEDFYRRAKEILCKNRGFLTKMAEALATKDVLLAADIADIRAGCEVIGVAL